MNYYTNLDIRELANLAYMNGEGLPAEAIGQLLEAYEGEDALACAIAGVFEDLEDGVVNVLRCLLKIAMLVDYDLDLDAVRENMAKPATGNGA
jgi:hypothetical protein